ncbi:MAG: hypothetical protein LBS69_01065 [Prevotellaceae bacterium]|jgi:hypothetical protein|nr:hypothetical protein [Prevotellaceae bacterium]
MAKRNFLLVAIVSIIILTTSCNGATKQQAANTNDVYVVGYEMNKQYKTVAKLWHNGEAQNLSDGTTNMQSNSTFVSGNDVYVVGYENNDYGVQIAKLWKNGVVQNLTNGTNSAYASSVFVSGNDVYVVGHEKITTWMPILWKNSVAQKLTDGNHYAMATSVYVYNDDVYVVGCEENKQGKCVAKVWKNGVGKNLTNGTCDAIAKSIFVSDGNVYVVGWEENEQSANDYGNIKVAKVWKNEVVQNLTDGSKSAECSSVFVTNNDVYIVGYESKDKSDYFVGDSIVAKLWKNGIEQSLSDGTDKAWAKSVYILNNDVYVAGFDGNDAILWKNGVAQKISKGTAECVFVK